MPGCVLPSVWCMVSGDIQCPHVTGPTRKFTASSLHIIRASAGTCDGGLGRVKKLDPFRTRLAGSSGGSILLSNFSEPWFGSVAVVLSSVYSPEKKY